MSTSIWFFGLHVPVVLWELVCGGFIQLANSGLVTIGGYMLHRFGGEIEVAGYDRSGETAGNDASITANMALNHALFR